MCALDNWVIVWRWLSFQLDWVNQVTIINANQLLQFRVWQKCNTATGLSILACCRLNERDLHRTLLDFLTLATLLTKIFAHFCDVNGLNIDSCHRAFSSMFKRRIFLFLNQKLYRELHEIATLFSARLWFQKITNNYFRTPALLCFYLICNKLSSESFS